MQPLSKDPSISTSKATSSMKELLKVEPLDTKKTHIYAIAVADSIRSYYNSSVEYLGVCKSVLNRAKKSGDQDDIDDAEYDLRQEVADIRALKEDYDRLISIPPSATRDEINKVSKEIDSSKHDEIRLNYYDELCQAYENGEKDPSWYKEILSLKKEQLPEMSDSMLKQYFKWREAYD